MWTGHWRDELWSGLDQPWDIVVVGGGITGAGILREAVRLGLRVLLVEQRDFGWGTSSRSSKLVHGGLRYLATGQLGLTWASVREREQLLAEGPGLIERLGFLIATHKGDKPGRWTYSAGLSLYDLMARRWRQHRHYNAAELRMLAPHIAAERLEGGFRYGDAQTDDARLTLRVIREAVEAGGAAINYVRADTVLRSDGRVTGVRVRDQIEDRTADVLAPVVINATGAWADRLRRDVVDTDVIRPLRGSHLVFPRWRLPLAQAVSFLHPVDGRYVFAFPWEGVTLVGTTDVDHPVPLDEEPVISPEEVAYLMAAASAQFPSRNLALEDIIATFAGVRPVIGTGKADPSKESRDHVVWQENGLLTITGGKLTTFRLIALDALKAVRQCLPDMPPVDEKAPALNRVDLSLLDASGLDAAMRTRLLGRYGADAPLLVAAAQPGELAPIPGTQVLWAELRWAARAEGVVRLDDLLLRRVRLGLLLPGGGMSLLPRIRNICQPELDWDDTRWESEAAAYEELWRTYYSLPDLATIPDWRGMLSEARTRDQLASASSRWQAFVTRIMALVGLLVTIRLIRTRWAGFRLE